MKKVFRVNKGKIDNDDPDIIKFLENALVIQRKGDNFESWKLDCRVTIMIDPIKRRRKVVN